MGLDMYAYAEPLDDQGQAIPDRRHELHQWRKHHDLHGWMERLYRQRGGTESFNCVPLRLEAADLDALEQAILQRQLPPTTGPYFGAYPPDDESDADDLGFIQRARRALRRGLAVTYNSWW